MTEQTQLKRKRLKRKSSKNIRAYEWLEEAPQTRDELEKRIIAFMRDHVGKDNATNPRELFEEVWRVSPYEIEVYKRAYLWSTLKRICAELRRTGRLMIIIRSYDCFVLKTHEELKHYENRINSLIEGLKETKIKAREWVDKEKWRKF